MADIAHLDLSFMDIAPTARPIVGRENSAARTSREIVQSDRKKMQSLNFRTCYEANCSLLIKVAYHVTGSEEIAEDIVHDAFMRLLDKLPNLSSPDDVKFWLIRVVKNASLNYVKRKGREVRAYQKWFIDEPRKVATAADTETLDTEATNSVQAALNKLSENLRAVLVLKEYTDMNYKEIGRTLGISEGTVKVRVFRARKELAKLLAGEVNYVP